MTTISVDFYLPRIPDDALAALLDLTRTRIMRRARLFGRWLECLLERERRRRLAVEAGQFVEVDWPELPIVQWSDSDVADALHCATVLSYSVRDPAAGKLADKLVVLLTATACRRLRR